MYARRQKPAKGFRYLPLLNGCHNREKRRRNTYDFQDSQWRTARRLHVVPRGSDQIGRASCADLVFRYLRRLNGCHNREKRRRNTYDFQDSQWRTARRLHVVRRGSDRGCCRRCSADESRLQESERHEVGQDDEVLREKVSSTHFNCTEAAGPQTRCFFLRASLALRHQRKRRVSFVELARPVLLSKGEDNHDECRKPRKIEERLMFIGDMAEAKGKTRQRVHR